MALKIAVEPAVEPVSLAEAKLHCRVDVTADDTLLSALVVAARRQAERILYRALVTQTWDLYRDAAPEEAWLEIPYPPLQSVSYVKYTPVSTGVAATYAAASYSVDAISEPGRLVLNSGYSWPSDELVVVNGFNVRFVAGYGAAAAVPQTIRHAILLMVGFWYEFREAVGEVPKGIVDLLTLERMRGF